ncbi:MAG: ABC transporter substrate-binding protein [Alphaproteobacteria bacterium]|nr:ABC transporter substrate-binding protein [Alphaproteobacteria bacterium]
MNRLWRSTLVIAMLAIPVSAFSEDLSTEKAKAKVEQVGQEVLKIASNESRSLKARRTELEKVFMREVDVAWIGRFVLGRQYRASTPEQQKRYEKLYAQFLVKHYTSKFSEYAGESFQVLSSEPMDGGDVMVHTQIVRQGQPPIIANYRLRKGDGGEARVNDIVIEGVSLLTTQRAEFASVVSRQGMDYLLDSLEKKIQEFDTAHNPADQ